MPSVLIWYKVLLLITSLNKLNKEIDSNAEDKNFTGLKHKTV